MPSSALPPSEEANGRSRVLTGSGLPASRPAPGSDLSPIPTARWGQAAGQTRPYSLRPQIRPAGAAWLPIEPDPGPARGSSARREATGGAAAPRNDAGCRVPPRAERASGGAQGGRAASVGAEGQLRGVAYHLNDACEAAGRRALRGAPLAAWRGSSTCAAPGHAATPPRAKLCCPARARTPRPACRACAQYGVCARAWYSWVRAGCVPARGVSCCALAHRTAGQRGQGGSDCSILGQAAAHAHVAGCYAPGPRSQCCWSLAALLSALWRPAWDVPARAAKQH